MPKQPRRLPGGRARKVRKPARADEPRRQPAREQMDATAPAAAKQTATDAYRAEPVTDSEHLRSVPSPHFVPVGRPTAAQAVRESRVRGSMRERQRPSQLDAVAAAYVHVRRDLTRIGVLAAVMFALLIALSFVIK